MTIQINENYCAVLSCGALYDAVQGGCHFESEDKILNCDYLNEIYSVVFFCAAVD